MSRLLPQPITATLIVGLWLALTPAPGWGSVALAIGLGVGLPLLTARFWPHPPQLRRPMVAVWLTFRVLLDIFLANLTVARQVLGPLKRLSPAFVDVPLDLDDAFVATLLGGIVSLTPGTVTVDIEMDDGRPVKLLVHGIDVPDGAALVAEIKLRYEAPLKEIFGC